MDKQQDVQFAPDPERDAAPDIEVVEKSPADEAAPAAAQSEGNPEIISLLPERKLNFTRLIFSRLPLFAVLLVLQVLIYLALYGWLRDFIPHFIVIQTVFSVGMIFYLFNCSMDSSAKLTWLAIIMLFPFLGTILLLYTRVEPGHRNLSRRSQEMLDVSADFLSQDPDVLAEPQIEESGTADLHHYLNRGGCFPIYRNTEVTYFPLGEDKYKMLLTELKKAKQFIYMEYFILAEGEMWGTILGILAQKAKEGVDVRVMFDGMCETSRLSFDYPKRVEKLGIRCKAFAPITPFLSTHYNYRDHRKILVIDGEVAFNGGINLADEYINKLVRFGHWKDTAVMLRGEAVRSFTLMFLQMWNITEREPDWKASSYPAAPCPAKGFVMPYGDSPLDKEKVGEAVYMDILNRANDYVYIMTPYLILDGELEASLKFAAQRGVDVRLILPGIPDKKTAYALAKTHYASLVSAGIKIYEYTPGFVHAKVVVCDDIKAVVGTINLDYRSLYHHFECATYMYDVDCIEDIKRDFHDTLQKCRPVTPETIRNEKITYKIAGRVLKVIAPLM